MFVFGIATVVSGQDPLINYGFNMNIQSICYSYTAVGGACCGQDQSYQPRQKNGVGGGSTPSVIKMNSSCIIRNVFKIYINNPDQSDSTFHSDDFKHGVGITHVFAYFTYFK